MQKKPIFKTREVFIGPVGLGNNNPVRIQSMTTSNTRDVDATVEQVMRLADNGCEIVRLTVQGMKEAESCEKIKNTLLQKGYNTPLVADIHFFPPAALRVTDFVEKIRINPGNYVDKRASFQTLEYDELSYNQEIEKIEEKFTPLVEKCKKLKKAMRIGTNHGSLSDRIMNRYGDTPRGMVESAFEFAQICRKHDYHDFIFSMKASNPLVMITAYRLLVSEMLSLGWDYPIHLGVTEAGALEDGRIKSAMGIGALLLDGIGDTIRVSLTEDPWNELPPCRELVSFAKTYKKGSFLDAPSFSREVRLPKRLSLHPDGTVVMSATCKDLKEKETEPKADCFVLKNGETQQPLDRTLFHTIPSLEECFITSRFSLTNTPLESIQIFNDPPERWPLLKTLKPDLIFLSPAYNRLNYSRAFFSWLHENQMKTPVILAFSYDTPSKETLIIQASAEYGSLFSDGLGEGIWIQCSHDKEFVKQLSFSILQSARKRTFKTDFISCPSCGRTLFDLQEVSKEIRGKTNHLPGVKIAIMGCIVNGPGEMADADFGYVGSKPGMIDLYVGKTCVEKEISFASATEKLIDLIKKHGRWIDPIENQPNAK